MKNLILLFALCFVGITIAEAQGPKKPKGKNKVKLDFPYVADYSSKFSLGDETYSAIVVNLWKDFEDNDFERNKNLFAENVVMELSEGGNIQGRDNLVISAKEFRGNLMNFKTKISSWVSLKSEDHNENWVAVWGEDSYSDKDGNMIVSPIHELWRFNKEGKVDYVKQYAAK